MSAKIRIARATNDLNRITDLYKKGLGLTILGSFQNHSGFDGVMLGNPKVDYHFEFTFEHGKSAPLSNSAENLVIFYIPERQEAEKLKVDMISAGFINVKSHNPYWENNGYTFEDFEGFRVVICFNKWK